MRNAAVAVLVCLVALSAAAKIESVEPTEFVANSGEQFINIYGTELGDTVVFSGGKAGELKLEISAKTERGVIAYVPDEIIANEGRYTLSMDNAGIATFDVVVAKIADPLVLQVPDPVTAPATGRDGARVSFTVWPLGGGDPRPVVTCDHASGDLFPIGNTIVKCNASNALGEHASGEVFVTVYDGTPPTLIVPHKIVVPAESREGAIVKWEATASDLIDGAVSVSCDPKSGSLFPIGITTVECTASDASFNVGVATFTVEVFEGKQKLVINVPDPIFVEAEGPDGAFVKYEVSASGTDDPNPEVNCDPKSGSLFAFGGTTVKCTAKDRFGEIAEDSFSVTVMDTIAPMILKVSASPNVLTPVEGQLVDVTISVDAKDSVDPMPRCAVADVTSNEAINGDWFVAKDLVVQLRAEGDGRIYTVNVHCADASDNYSTSSVDVRVGAGAGALSGSPSTTNPPSKRRAGGQ